MHQNSEINSDIKLVFELGKNFTSPDLSEQFLTYRIMQKTEDIENTKNYAMTGTGTFSLKEVSKAFNAVEEMYGQRNFEYEIINYNKRFSKYEFAAMESIIDDYLRMDEYLN